MTISRRVFFGAVGSFAGIATTGCLGTGGDRNRVTAGGPGAARTVKMVTKGMPGGNSYFNPIGVFVSPGQTVRWVNHEGTHSATAYQTGNAGASVTRIPDGTTAWDSGTFAKQGATFDHTFEVEGTYDYFCIPHKSVGMVGRVVVGEPGGPADGSMPPDGEVPDGRRIVDQGVVSYNEFL